MVLQTQKEKLQNMQSVKNKFEKCKEEKKIDNILLFSAVLVRNILLSRNTVTDKKVGRE